MAGDIDPNAIPFVPDTSVALIDTATGKPKTAFHDWLQGLYDWMKRSVVDLTTKVTTLTDETGGNTAEIEQITQALTDGTGAYGSYITTIDVRADQATAGGEVGFYAAAGPSGSIAAYEIALNAGASLAGMQIIAWSGGTSAIGFYADQFVFVDSGAGVPVFTYAGGKFGFTGAVEINGSLAVNGSFTALAVASGFSNRGSTADTVTITDSAVGWTDLGAPMVMAIEPDATTGNVHPIIWIRDGAEAENTGAGPLFAQVEVRLLVDGVPVYSHIVLSGSLAVGEFRSDGLTDFMEIAVPGASHTFQLQYQCNYNVGVDGFVFAKVMVVMISR